MPLPPTAVLTVSSGHLDAARCLHVAHRAPCLRNIMGFQRIPSDLSGFMWNVWGTLLRARITSCEQIDLQWNELLHNKVWMCMVVEAATFSRSRHLSLNAADGFKFYIISTSEDLFIKEETVVWSWAPNLTHWVSQEFLCEAVTLRTWS